MTGGAPPGAATTSVVRATRSATAALGAALVLAVLCFVTGDSWLMLLACAPVGMLVAGHVLRPRLPGTGLRVSAEPAGRVGDALPARIVLTNISGRTSAPLVVTFTQACLEPTVLLVEPLPAGGSVTVTGLMTVTARGYATEAHVAVVGTSPFGLWRETWELDVPFVLHARPGRAVPVPLGPGPLTADGDGAAVVRRDGLDVHGVREWRQGDAAGSIHWRASARRGRVVVLEREAARAARVTFLVLGPADQPGFEGLLATVAATACAAARSGHHVRLVRCEEGRPGLEELVARDPDPLLDWLAEVAQPRLAAADELDAVLAGADGGDVVLASCVRPPTDWLRWADARCTAAAVRLVPLARPASAPQASGRP